MSSLRLQVQDSNSKQACGLDRLPAGVGKQLNLSAEQSGKTRVAFFAEILTEDLDGAVRTMYQLINRIDKERFDFLFIYGKGPDTIAGHQSLKIPSVSLPVNVGYALAIPSLVQNFISSSLQNFRPDVIHIATPSLLGNWALTYAKRRGIPALSIYHTHFISYIDYYFKYVPFVIPALKKLLAARHKAFYNRCDKLYVPSQSIKEELLQMGVQEHLMQIWQRGVDTRLFSPDKRDGSFLQNITGNQRPTILFASRLVWEKNLETLFAIYDLIQKKALAVNLLIAGSGTAAKACQARMPNAFFVGKVDHAQLSVLYASADIFLFPSVSETYGNVVVEAMASGLPCVIADGGGSKDFISQGVNGFRCKPYEAADYVARICLLLADDALRAKLIAAGLHASRRLGWDELAATYFNDLEAYAGSAKTALAIAGALHNKAQVIFS